MAISDHEILITASRLLLTIVDDGVSPEHEQGKLAAHLRALLDYMEASTLRGGWPTGYQPDNGMPSVLTIDDVVPPRCDKIINDQPTE